MNYDIAIVGAGPAGLTAGIYACRAGLHAVIFESTGIGGQIAQAGHVENYPAFASTSGLDLSNAMYEQAEKLGCAFVFDRVKEIVPTDGGFHIACDFETAEAKTVILATGAQCRHLGIPGEEELIGHGVSYCAVCDGAFYRDRDVIVVGGGNSALEDAIYLSGYCRSVTLVHRRDTFRADAAEIAKIADHANIHTKMSCRPVSVNRTEKDGMPAFASLTLTAPDGATEDLSADGLFIAVGRVPQNEPFSALAILADGGYANSSEDCLTKTPGVFVAGDCRTKTVRQLTTAIADGSVAALAAVAYLERNGVAR